jgi:hypothetical protein
MSRNVGIKATQKLPSTYTPYDKFKPSKWRRTHWVNWSLGIALAWLSYSVLRFTAQALRPDDFQPPPLGFTGPIYERLGSVLVIILPLAVVLAGHELIHFILLWFFTGHRPTIVTGNGGFAVQMPAWYIPRDQFLFVSLAPFCIISLVALFSLPVVPQGYLNLVVFLTAMNVASSVADITSSGYLLLHPSSIYLETEGTIYFDRFVGPDEVPAWKLGVRSSIEAAIARLDPSNEVS